VNNHALRLINYEDIIVFVNDIQIHRIRDNALRGNLICEDNFEHVSLPDRVVRVNAFSVQEKRIFVMPQISEEMPGKSPGTQKLRAGSRPAERHVILLHFINNPSCHSDSAPLYSATSAYHDSNYNIRLTLPRAKLKIASAGKLAGLRDDSLQGVLNRKKNLR
jgi:hypothetical protein